MGKLVLGILAVVALQIAFSIYFAIDRRPVETSATPSGPAAGKYPVPSSAQTVPVDSSSDRRDSNALELPAEAPASTVSPLPKAWLRTRRSNSNVTYARSRRVDRNVYLSSAKHSYRAGDPAAEMTRREYFGAMLVETSFPRSAARSARLAKAKNRKLVFGKMTVEYRDAV